MTWFADDNQYLQDMLPSMDVSLQSIIEKYSRRSIEDHINDMINDALQNQNTWAPSVPVIYEIFVNWNELANKLIEEQRISQYGFTVYNGSEEYSVNFKWLIGSSWYSLNYRGML